MINCQQLSIKPSGQKQPSQNTQSKQQHIDKMTRDGKLYRNFEFAIQQDTKQERKYNAMALDTLIKKGKIPYVMRVYEVNILKKQFSVQRFKPKSIKEVKKDNINFTQILKLLFGLGQLHKLYIAHRDIKFQNMLKQPQLVLVDFGHMLQLPYTQDVQDLRQGVEHKPLTIQKINNEGNVTISISINQNIADNGGNVQNFRSIDSNSQFKVVQFCKQILNDLRKFILSFSQLINPQFKIQSASLNIDRKKYVYYNEKSKIGRQNFKISSVADKNTQEQSKISKATQMPDTINQTLLEKIFQCFSTANTDYIAIFLSQQLLKAKRISNLNLKEIFMGFRFSDQRARTICYDIIKLQIYLDKYLQDHYLQQLFQAIVSYRIARQKHSQQGQSEHRKQIQRLSSYIQQPKQVPGILLPNFLYGVKIWFCIVWIFFGEAQFLMSLLNFKRTQIQYICIQRKLFESWEQVQQFIKKIRKDFRASMRSVISYLPIGQRD